MKKCLMLGAICVLGAMLSGCAGTWMNNNGFSATPSGGFVVADIKGALMVQPRHPARKFQVLGKVKSEAKATGYLGLVSIGDVSYQTLKKAALEKYRDADDIIDIELDFADDNLLGLINKVYVNLNGTAIKPRCYCSQRAAATRCG